MIAALLLFSVSASDLLGALFLPRGTAQDDRRTNPWYLVVGTVVALALGAASWLTLGVPPAVAIVIAALTVGWLLAVGLFTSGDRSVPLLSAAALLTVLLTAGLAIGPLVAPLAVAAAGSGASGGSSVPLLDAYQQLIDAIDVELPLALLIGAVATLLFLTRPANLICRAALGRSLSDDESTAPPEPRRWALRIRSREVARVVESVPAVAPAATATGTNGGESEADARTSLKGGRVIGPLERLLIAALALLGAQAIIVGLLAAKGIVRFPEISADGRRGSKAEEFLVGSLVSWTIAGLGAAFVAVLHNGL